MHSNNQQFEADMFGLSHSAFEKLRTSGRNQDVIDTLESKVHEFLNLAFDPYTPMIIVQNKLVEIKKMISMVDSIDNHGYIIQSYGYANTLRQGNDELTKQQSVDTLPELQLFKKMYMNEENTEEKTIVDVANEPTEEEKWALELSALEQNPQPLLTKADAIDIQSIQDLPMGTQTNVAGISESAISRKARKTAVELVESFTNAPYSIVSTHTSLLNKVTTYVFKLLSEAVLETGITPSGNNFQHKTFFYQNPFALDALKKTGEIVHLYNQPYKTTHVGKMPYGLELTTFSPTEDAEPSLHERGVSFLVAHDGKDIHHVLKVEHPKEYHDDTLVAKTVSKNPNLNSPYKSYQLYHHLIRNGFTLVGDDHQSPGDISSWRNLSKLPDVEVYGWDMKKNQPVNTDEHLDDLSDSHFDLYAEDDPDEIAARSINTHGVRLVASKRKDGKKSLNEIYEFQSGGYNPATTHNWIYSSSPEEIAQYHSGISDMVHEHTFPSGHVLKHYAEKNGKRGSIIVQKDGKITHVMDYKKQNPSVDTMTVSLISKNPEIKKSPIEMHHIYNHMLDQGHAIESDDAQTPEGKRVWQRLSRMKGVNINGWDSNRNIPVNTDRYLRNTEDVYGNEESIRSKADLESARENQHAANYVTLVAWKEKK